MQSNVHQFPKRLHSESWQMEAELQTGSDSGRNPEASRRGSPVSQLGVGHVRLLGEWIGSR